MRQYASRSRRPRNAHCNLRREKIEVTPAVRLLHGVEKELAITALVERVRLRRLPLLAARCKLGFVDEKLELALRHVETDPIAVLHQRKRAADGRFGCDVQDDRSESGAAHARVRNSHHVFHALLSELLRDRYIAGF